MLETPAVQVSEEKFLIHNLVKREPRAGLAEDVRRGLATQPKRFLPKYFYDQLGSQLFEAICLLPEYYLTRAENEILDRYAVTRSWLRWRERSHSWRWAAAAPRRRDCLLKRCSGNKAELLFIPVDISASALDQQLAHPLAIISTAPH